MRAARAVALSAAIGLGAAAPAATPVFPREAAGLPPVALADLVYATMLPAAAARAPWDHPHIRAVRWLTLGVEPQGQGGYRIGVARVRAGRVKTTVLRRRLEELAWTAQAETRGAIES